jgi:hypothetical protein
MTNSSVPGITYPTVQATVAGSPRDAAIANNAAMNAKQAEANRMTAGSKKKRGGAVTVGVPQVSYTPTGGPGQDPTAITKSNAQYGSQGAANAEFDKNALKGGSRRRKGGNPDWIWGCYSGGKKRKTRTNKRKTRKHKKKTRRNKK